MSETTPEPTTPEPTAPAEPTPTSEESKGNREAAKYRTQLRDTETALAAAQQALTAARQQILRTHLDGYEVDGKRFRLDALPDAGLDVATLFTDEGELDTDKLTQSMAALAESRPYMFAERQRLIVPSEGKHATISLESDKFADAFAPKP